MATYLLTNIEWDTDDMSAEDCGLPSSVLVLDVPEDADPDDLSEAFSEGLSDTFGFCHKGFDDEPFHPANHPGGFYPQGLAAMPCPEL